MQTHNEMKIDKALRRLLQDVHADAITVECGMVTITEQGMSRLLREIEGLRNEVANLSDMAGLAAI